MSKFHLTPEWVSLSRKMRAQWTPSIDAGGMACIDCGALIHRGQKWHVGHIQSAALHPHLALSPSNLGPSHASCNLKDGGRKGADVTNRQRVRKRDGEFRSWS